MKNELQNKLSMFADNWQTIKKEFKWHSPQAKRMTAMLYAITNKPINCAEIKDSLSLIKRSTGIFSAFRGNMSLCVAAMLSLNENRKDMFARTMSVYELLKKEKFRASDYLAVAACEIAAHAKPEEFQQTVSRARAFYKGMKANGAFRTNQSDYIFSALLGLSGMDVENGTERIERLYQRFKPEFSSGSGTQKLAQILALGGESETAANCVFALNNALKSRKIRLDKAYTLPSLGVFALLPADIDAIVRDIEDAKAFLKMQKGFGTVSVSNQELLLFAAGVVASVYADDVRNDLMKSSITTSIISIIIAQLVAMMVVIVAASAAASSATSG